MAKNKLTPFPEHLLWAHLIGHNVKCPWSRWVIWLEIFGVGVEAGQTTRNDRNYGNWRECSPPEKRSAFLSLVHGFLNVIPWVAPQSWKPDRCRLMSQTCLILPNQASDRGGLGSVFKQMSNGFWSSLRVETHCFLVAQMVENLPAMQTTWVWSQHWEDHLEKGMCVHSSILAWKIPWTEEGSC